MGTTSYGGKKLSGNKWVDSITIWEKGINVFIPAAQNILDSLLAMTISAAFARIGRFAGAFLQLASRCTGLSLHGELNSQRRGLNRLQDCLFRFSEGVAWQLDFFWTFTLVGDECARERENWGN